ncbi:MAG: hypothetical protein ACJAS1_005840 [Oleiphilaceae bacterium]|jgi:hypothetical protein
MNITSPEDLLEAGTFKAGILSALKSYLFTQTVVEHMRPSHDAVSKAAMEKFKPVVEDRAIYHTTKRKGSMVGNIIECYERLYLASDEATDVIYAYYAEEMANLGFKSEGGKCPWLVACNIHMMAEGLLIDVMETYTQVSNTHVHIKGNRDKYVNIVVGLLVQVATKENIELNLIEETLKEPT